jgi:hypothetical protein
MSGFVHAERDLPARDLRLSPGWTELLTRLNAQLHAMDPPARAGWWPNDAGAATIRLYDPRHRSEALALCDDAERRLAQTCERCGAPGRARIAGQAIQVICDRCGGLA